MTEFQLRLYENIFRLKNTAEHIFKSGDYKSALYFLITSLEETLKLDAILLGEDLDAKAFNHKKKFQTYQNLTNKAVEQVLTDPRLLIARHPNFPPEKIIEELNEHEKSFRAAANFYTNPTELRKKLMYVDSDFKDYQHLLEDTVALKGVFEHQMDILNDLIGHISEHKMRLENSTRVD